MIKKINPKITQQFLKEIKTQKYTTKKIDGIKIKIFPGVFPPKSDFSRSSIKMYSIFGNIKGKNVLDIGTGTGIQAIRAAKAGAKKVVAVDINNSAVLCAKENVAINGFENIIKVFKSDLFKKVGKDRFDLIIANLPIVDYFAKNTIELALYDPGLKIHKCLFSEASKYLNKNGSVVFPHTNFQSKDDFKIIENLIKKYNFRIVKIIQKNSIGYIWRIYKIKSNY